LEVHRRRLTRKNQELDHRIAQLVAERSAFRVAQESTKFRQDAWAQEKQAYERTIADLKAKVETLCVALLEPEKQAA
jgi:hypothetical protein